MLRTLSNPMSRTLGIFVAVLAAAAAPSVLAQQKTLYIGMNGGAFEKIYTEHIFPTFEKANDVKVVVVPGTSTDILAKVQATKEKPQMHVMFLDDGVMYRAITMGLCEKLKPSPVLGELHPAARLKGDMAAGVSIGMTGLAYNPKVFTEKGWAPPTSWMDLANPKFKGKVVFQSLPSSTFGLHGFLMVNRIQGGDDKNVEPGFKAWPTTIGPNVLEYIPSSAKLSEMVQTGEAALFPLTPTMVATFKGRGLPIEYVQPKEGSVMLMTAQCVIARNSDPEMAQKLAEYLLTPDVQAKALQHGNYNPSNARTKPATEASAKEFKVLNDYLKTAVTVDWDTINENRPVWNQRWNRSVER
jgi:putative spermidine/putrescine transport system substrate-binding protein